MKNASGKWITFVDADDVLQPQFLENLLICVKQHPIVEMVQAGCTNLINEEIRNVEQTYKDTVTDDSTYIYNNVRGLTFSKYFLKSVIEAHDLKFDEKMPLAEDLAFTLDYINCINTVAFSSETGYLYRRHPDSVTSKKLVRPYEVHLSGFYHLFNSINNYASTHNISKKDRIKREQHIGCNLFYTIYSLYQNNMGRKERIRHLNEDFNTCHFSLFRSKPFGSGVKQLVTLPLIYGFTTIFDCVFSLLYRLKH